MVDRKTTVVGFCGAAVIVIPTLWGAFLYHQTLQSRLTALEDGNRALNDAASKNKTAIEQLVKSLPADGSRISQWSGTWTGKWDNIWHVEFTTIPYSADNAIVIYRYKKLPDDDYEITSSLDAKVQGDLLQIDDFITLSPSKDGQVVATGVFQNTAKRAVLTRKKNSTTPSPP